MLPSSYFGILYFYRDMKEPLHVFGELCTLPFPVALLRDRKLSRGPILLVGIFPILDPNCLPPPLVPADTAVTASWTAHSAGMTTL